MKIEAVPKGFQDVYEGVGDEPFENPELQNAAGTSTADVKQTAKDKIEVTFRGDGDIGPSSVDLVVDGHIGDGDVPIRTSFEWDTISPDATKLDFTKVRREPIP